MKYGLIKIPITVLLSIVLFACRQEVPLISLGIDDVYLIQRMQALHLEPAFTGEQYEWRLKKSDGQDSLLSSEQNYVFLAKETGEYHLHFEIKDKETPVNHQIKIVVVDEQVAYSPYIARVYEYCPAPGQFINKLPQYTPGDTERDMTRKAEEYIARNNQQTISLGGFGGYVTFGFDHTVINVPGEADFKIDGNAFVAATHGNVPRKGGSSEPGIVMVSFDANNNGMPDDEWYELAGSEYHKPETTKNYEITYSRPDPNKPPVKGTGYNLFLTDMTYIPWKDNSNAEGYIFKNQFHTQSYWPMWLNDKALLTFRGTKLNNNATDESPEQDGSYYVQYFYDRGYADNLPNDMDEGFNIEWAVDKQGNPVHLQGIDFVRVYTGLNQYCGRLGETSTEISGARDLHIHVKPVRP